MTDERAVIAVQGPEARERLSEVSPEAAAVHRFAVERFEWGGATCLVAGTGYTGEDGVECAVPAEVAADFWEAVLAAGRRPGRAGGRDTLRLEAGLPLHGHELGPGITPLQAGLGWVVGWDKGELHRAGRARRGAGQRTRPPPPRLRRRRAPAHARRLGRLRGRDQVGILTSGNFSPMRERGIGLGFVDADAQLLDGDEVTVLQRGRELDARLVRPPLWPVREDTE